MEISDPVYENSVKTIRGFMSEMEKQGKTKDVFSFETEILKSTNESVWWECKRIKLLCEKIMEKYAEDNGYTFKCKYILESDPGLYVYELQKTLA